MPPGPAVIQLLIAVQLQVAFDNHFVETAPSPSMDSARSGSSRSPVASRYRRRPHDRPAVLARTEAIVGGDAHDTPSQNIPQACCLLTIPARTMPLDISPVGNPAHRNAATSRPNRNSHHDVR